MDKDLDNQLLEDQALDLFNNQENYSLASLKYRRLLKSQPLKKNYIYCWLADAHVNQNHPPNKAYQKYKKAVFFSGSEASPINLSFAQFLFRQNKFEEADIEIQKYLQSDPSDPEGLFLQGKIYSNYGLYEEADKIFIQVFNQDPNHQGLYNGWACNQYFQGNFDKAKEYLLKLLEQDPENSETQRMVGHILLVKQEYQEAICCFEKAIELDKSNSFPWLNWSQALMLQDKHEEAMVKLKKGIQLLDNGNRFTTKEILYMLNQDLEFKQRYIESEEDKQRKITLKANIESQQKIISLLEQNHSHL